jgi:biofilm PGA synthesis N-glycosyltransferase PgaC
LGIPKKQQENTFLPWVTIVIPAYNEESVIGSTIDSIQQQKYPLKKIIVVDDCSTDSTNEIARSKGVIVLKTPKNTGKKASAQKYGFEHVDTPIAIVVDADTLLAPDAIEIIIQPLADKNTLSSCGYVIPQKIETFWEKMRTVEYFYSFGFFKSAQENMGCPLVSSGCFTAFRMDILNKLGGFPDNNIAEDMAITWMGHMAGYRVRFISDAICYPKDPENYVQYKRQIMRWYRGMFQCLKDFKISVFKKPLLGIMIVYYMFFGLCSLPAAFFIGVLAYSFFTSNIITAILYVLLIETMLGFSAVTYNGYKHKQLKIAITYYPTIYIANIINWVAILASMVQELVLKNRLAHWEKGH